MQTDPVRPPLLPTRLFLATCLLAAALAAPASAQGATLGTVTSVDRAAGKLTIDGQTYRVDSFSKVTQAGVNGEEDVAAWYSLNVGDYVIFDDQDGRIRSLRRETADSLDRPAARPLELGETAPSEH